MKKIFILFCFLIIAPITCSERSWLRNKVDTFAKQLATRHTYEYNSWEHKRDRALLCLLPAKTSQMILTNQRFNMIKFLKKNEEDALEDVFKYWNIDEPTIVKIKSEIKKAHEFNLEEIKKPHNAFHDPSLPPKWVSIIKDRCKQRSIHPQSLHLTLLKDTDVHLAEARSEIPSWGFFWDSYNPATILLGMQEWNKTQEIYDQKKLGKFEDDEITLRNIVDHELTHITEGHNLSHKVLIYHVPNMTKKGWDQYLQSPNYSNFTAAKEKTADTLLACTNTESSKNSVCHRTITRYKANHNDMKVIHANWQTSQAITRFQQLKNSIKQKLTVFPKPFA